MNDNLKKTGNEPIEKWIRYVPDRIDDGLRYLCGRMSPDVRLVCVVVMLTGFGCLSIYMTVSSIYRIGRHEGAVANGAYQADGAVQGDKQG